MHTLKSVLTDSSKNYRPLTFWSWNNELDNNRLKEQIHDLKDAGFGGFFMHARYGLKTEYMSNKWFSAVDFCIKEAKKQGMSAWCYDENGYPSGFAGMELLKNRDYLARYLTVGKTEYSTENPICVFGICDNKPVFDNLDKDNGEVYEIYVNLSPANVDLFNKNVINEFIELTHEKYYEKFGEYFGTHISGFFTDEPQYFRYGTPYSEFIADEYKTRYDENITNILPYLFFELESFKEYRWRYYKLINDLYTEGFIKSVYEWCKAHNVMLTGHTIEESLLFAQMWCCAGVMPFYEYEDIPGCDWLGRNISNQLNPKQVGSAAQQLGKKQTLTESFACAGWDVNPRELKRLVDWQYANGINMLCTHLTPYSMEGGRKYDHPAHFSSVNPIFSSFAVLSKYIENLGCMMGESKELANVGVIHPIHSAYLTYNRKDDADSVEKLDTEFDNLLRKLARYNIPHHLIDETLLKKHGKVENNEIIVGLCRYDAIVIPSMEQIDEFTAQILKEYASNGGKIHLFGEKPSLINGKKANLDFLQNNIAFEDLVSDTYRIDTFTTDLSSVYRSSDAGDFLFVFNGGENTQKAVYSIKTNGAAKMDLLTGDILPLEFEKKSNGYIDIVVELNVYESQMILLGDYKSASDKKGTQKELPAKKISNKCIDNNILVIDTAAFSYDGQNFSSPMNVEAIQAKLLKEHYCGNLYLRYNVYADDEIENIIIEAEKMNCNEVKINGQIIYLDGKGIFDPDFVSAKVLSGIKQGENNLDFCCDFHQNSHVYDVLDNICPESESLINCLVYDTELAPITLYGNFTVKGQNEHYNKDNTVCYSNPFVLSNCCSSDLLENITEAYPFYDGKVESCYKVDSVENKECKLKLNGRFLSAHIQWNDYETELVLSDSAVIPAQYVKEINSVKVTVQLSNRNRLGPHHWANSFEPLSVWPACFNMSGTWDSGKSNDYNAEYAFINHRFSIECSQSC